MALTAEKELVEKDGVLVALPMAVEKIFRGAICMINSAGYLANAATGAGSYFAGIAEQTVDNSAGSAGDAVCRVKKEGRYLLEGSGFVQADVGESVYASDNDTITKTSLNNPLVGQIDEFVSATQVWVKLERNPAVSA